MGQQSMVAKGAATTGSGRQFSTLWRYVRFQARDQRKTLLFWAIGLGLYSSLIVVVYPQVKDAVDISLMPANMREAFNITDFTQLASFLATELFGVILPIVVPFFGVIALSGVIAGAEERGRLDLLLGNPIPRWQLVVGSFAVVAAFLFVLATVIACAIWLAATALDLALTFQQSARAAFALWPLAVAFAALALALSAVVRQRAAALGGTAGILFLMFLTNVIGRLAPPVSGIRWASAYHYYGNAIVDGLWWTGVAVLVGVALALVAVAVVAFDRRDIYA
jgi:ABC-2 type transport system permease protein